MKGSKILLILFVIFTSYSYSQDYSSKIKISPYNFTDTSALKSRTPEYLERYDADKYAYKYWLTFGFGWNGSSLAGNLAYTFSWDSYFGKVGYHAYGYELFSRFYHGEHEFRSLCLSVGKRLKSRWVHFTGFQGVSIAKVNEFVKHGEYKTFYTPGLQTELQVILKPADEIGIGIGVLANVNFAHSYAAVTANLLLGNGK